jgi:hypothetical protein
MDKHFELNRLGLSKLSLEEKATIEGGSEALDTAYAIAKGVGNALVDGANWLSGWVNRNLF